MRKSLKALILSSLICNPVFASNIHTEENYDLSNIEEENYEVLDIYDPIEPFNRTMFVVHKSLDKLVIRPVAVLYKDIVPDWGKHRIHSGISNMYEPVRFVNGLIQQDEHIISRTIGRFLSNTILGLGGLIDIASEADESLRLNEEVTFGKTLQHYGVEKGAYLFIPIFGPSSVRDGLGLGVDLFLDPFNYTNVVHKDFIIARTGVVGLDKRYQFLDATDTLEDISLDEYSAMRSAYWQKR